MLWEKIQKINKKLLPQFKWIQMWTGKSWHPGVSTLLSRNCLFNANYITKGVLKRHHRTVSALIKRPSLCQPNPNQSHDQCKVWFIRNAVCCTGRMIFSLLAVCCAEAAIKWTTHKCLHFTWFKEHCLGSTVSFYSCLLQWKACIVFSFF